jgi:hypothetical protein
VAIISQKRREKVTFSESWPKLPARCNAQQFDPVNQLSQLA